MNKKADMELDEMLYWIIGAIILILLVVGIIVITRKDTTALEFLRNLFRLRRPA